MTRLSYIRVLDPDKTAIFIHETSRTKSVLSCQSLSKLLTLWIHL